MSGPTAAGTRWARPAGRRRRVGVEHGPRFAFANWASNGGAGTRPVQRRTPDHQRGSVEAALVRWRSARSSCGTATLWLPAQHALEGPPHAGARRCLSSLLPAGEAVSPRPGHQARPAVHVELRHTWSRCCFSRWARYDQAAGDLLVGEPLGHEPHDVDLALGQAAEVFCGRRRCVGRRSPVRRPARPAAAAPRHRARSVPQRPDHRAEQLLAGRVLGQLPGRPGSQGRRNRLVIGEG